MVTLTGVGIYIVIVTIIGWCAQLYYIANGGTESGPGVLAVGLVWSMVNMFLMLTYGFNI